MGAEFCLYTLSNSWMTPEIGTDGRLQTAQLVRLQFPPATEETEFVVVVPTN